MTKKKHDDTPASDKLTQPDFRDRIRELREVELARITDFDGGNPKKPSKEFIAQLDASLMKNGFAKPFLVVDTEDGKFMTLDGHTRRERIQHLWPSQKRVKVLILDVKTQEEGKLLMLGLMASGEFDADALDEWVRKGLKNGLTVDDIMDVGGLTAKDLESLAEASSSALENALKNESRDILATEGPKDEVPSGPGIVVEVDIPDELPKKTVSRNGDVWTLGKNRLVVGDMTIPEVIAAALDGDRPDMIWTDPPWNVAYNSVERPSGRGAKSRPKMTIMNDALGDKFGEFAAAFCRSFGAAADPGVPIYVAMSTQEWGVVDLGLKAEGFHPSSVIIWAKQALVLGRKDFHSQYEPIWYGWKEGAPRKCAPTDRAISDLWTIDRPRKSELHPTMKPIALVARSIGCSSHPGNFVFDPFGGSGTTLLAAEQMGRRAALVELDPGYADVIVERWQKLTGKKAKRSGG